MAAKYVVPRGLIVAAQSAYLVHFTPDERRHAGMSAAAEVFARHFAEREEQAVRGALRPIQGSNSDVLKCVNTILEHRLRTYLEQPVPDLAVETLVREYGAPREEAERYVAAVRRADAEAVG